MIIYFLEEYTTTTTTTNYENLIICVSEGNISNFIFDLLFSCTTIFVYQCYNIRKPISIKFCREKKLKGVIPPL